MADIEREVEELERRAERVRQLLRYASRAFVIEFAGTPKAGKSTTVEAIRHFFSRNGFRVYILEERAAVCPIPMKGHLFFNTWCAASMLAELLANVETETDIIIVDRGLFDSLVWLRLQEKRGEVTDDEARTIESFLLLDRWRTLIDLAVVMRVSADEAASREASQRITRKAGTIMNPDVLAAITESVGEAIEQYAPKFSMVIDHQTTGRDVRETSVEIANKVLGSLESFLNPEILVVPREAIELLPLEHGGAFGDDAVRDAIKCIQDNGSFMRRDEAESNFDYVQIIPCGILANKDKDEVFLFQRKETDPKSLLYGKTTIWQGCHVSKCGETNISELLQNVLLERVSRSLFLSRVFPISALGYCWDKDDKAGSRHFGMAYRIEIDNLHTAVNLRNKEFKKRRGHGIGGRFVHWDELKSEEINSTLESWSRAILHGQGIKNG